MKKAFYFNVDTGEMSMTWIGGGLQKSKKPGYVWLTAPGGRKVMEVRQEHVTPSNQSDMANRLVRQKLASKSPLN